jgi:hypothetical protein
VHARVLGRRQLDLRGFGRVADALDRHAIPREVDAVLLEEPLEDVLHQAIVEVDAAEERVTAGRDDLEDRSLMSMTEMSNVPPPRSYTAMSWLRFLPRP